jgi:hypothetical protein
MEDSYEEEEFEQYKQGKGEEIKDHYGQDTSFLDQSMEEVRNVK